jgi:hypothetical protein
MEPNYYKLIGSQTKKANAAPAAAPGFSKLDGAEMIMDIGTSFIPFGSPIWQGLKAGYHGLTGQYGKMRSDIGWAAAGAIPGVAGVGKILKGGAKFMPALGKAAPWAAKASLPGKVLPRLAHGGVQMAAGTALEGATNGATTPAPAATRPRGVAQYLADQVP